MYTQVYPLIPQNFYYLPQIVNTNIAIPSYYSQLPFTYQNQYCLPSQQYISYPIQMMTMDQPYSNNTIPEKVQESQQTYQKSQQKKTQKKFSIFKYPKKNAQSNIINQIFSFLSLRVKSQPILQKILENNLQKIQNFYELLKQLKKKNKKYINRCYIKELALFQNDHIGQKIINEITNKGSKNALNVQEFKKALRILVNYYLKSKCISTVITSRKLDKQTMKQHLNRKRQVQNYFTTQMQISRDSKTQ